MKTKAEVNLGDSECFSNNGERILLEFEIILEWIEIASLNIFI